MDSVIQWFWTRIANSLVFAAKLSTSFKSIAGDNHNPMIVERVNRYLIKGLKIMTNEHDSVRIAIEAILLLLYAWNSCPIPGTDISRSLVCRWS